MKLSNMKLTGLAAGIVLIFCSFGAYAAVSPEKIHKNKDQINAQIKEVKSKVKQASGKIQDVKVIKLEPPSNLVVQGSSR